MKDIKENISEKTQAIPNNLEDTYDQIEKQENLSVNLAEKMKLKYNIQKVSNTNIHENIIQIRNNMEKINDKAQKIEDETRLDKTRKNLQKLEKLTHDNSIKKEHTYIIKKNFEKSFDSKIQELIKDSKISILEKEKEQVEEERCTFFEILMGKERFKNAKLDNIKLKIEMLSTEEHTKKLKNSLEDSLSDLYAYSQCKLGRDLTTEMQKLLDVVKTDKDLRKMINWKQLKQKFDEKVSNDTDNFRLIPADYKKESIRNKAHKLELQNDDIRTQLQNNRASRVISMQNNLSDELTNDESLNKFKNIVDAINSLTSMQNELNIDIF